MTSPRSEQALIDAAKHDGEGWAIAPDADAAIVRDLADRGLVRHHKGRWQLTPAGFARTATFKRAAD